jgi:hypothetical protein
VNGPIRLLALYGCSLAVLACGRGTVPQDGSAGNGGHGGAAGTGGGGGAAGICQSSGSVGFAGGPGTGGSCTPGNDLTCNDDPAVGTRLGDCFANRTCSCGSNTKSAFTGRCLNPGDDGSGCAYDGTTYGIGTTVPVFGCADRCSCTGPGAISCPPCACVPCALTQDYHFSIAADRSGAFFLPGNTVFLSRPNPGSDTGATCSAPLPRCDTPNAVDTSDLYADIADADVQNAFMMSPAPIYGDQAASPERFRFSSNGSGFTVVVGFDCPTPTSTCVPIPSGIRRLTDDVLAVVAHAIADQSCTDCCKNFW